MEPNPSWFEDPVRPIAKLCSLRSESEIEQFFSEEAPNLSAVLLEVAKNGWFIVPDIPVDVTTAALNDFAKTVSEEQRMDRHDLDPFFTLLNSRLMDHLEINLCSTYPDRAPIIHDGFWAHRHRRYNLSVPIFLIQTDGIWTGRFGDNLFSKKPRKETYEALRERHKDEFYFGYVFPLPDSLAVWQSSHSRDEFFNGLNRHLVLHGEDSSYGTELFSLKALAILGWVRWVTNLPDLMSPG